MSLNSASLRACLLIGASLVGCADLSEPVDASVCESGRRWIGDDEGHPEMNPGKPCVACHNQASDAPKFSIAGTFYASQSQSDGCFGAAGAEIVITDANGSELRLTSNNAGNFYSSAAIALPYSAKVIHDGKELVMQAQQQSGDCNSCHLAGGTRISPFPIAVP